MCGCAQVWLPLAPEVDSILTPLQEEVAETFASMKEAMDDAMDDLEVITSPYCCMHAQSCCLLRLDCTELACLGSVCQGA